MRKVLFIFLAVLMLLTGCTPAAQKTQAPVSFYYIRAEFDYNSADGVIAAELRESINCADVNEILELYFRGPDDETLQLPFPTSTELISVELKDNTAVITLTDNFSGLTGMNLTLACACITHTVINLTGATQVAIKAQTRKLNGQETIIMTLEDLLLIDSSKVVIDPN